MTYFIYKGEDGDWHWRLRASNHKIIAISGEGYKNKADCEAAIKLVKSSADAPVVDMNNS